MKKRPLIFALMLVVLISTVCGTAAVSANPTPNQPPVKAPTLVVYGVNGTAYYRPDGLLWPLTYSGPPGYLTLYGSNGRNTFPVPVNANGVPTIMRYGTELPWYTIGPVTTANVPGLASSPYGPFVEYEVGYQTSIANFSFVGNTSSSAVLNTPVKVTVSYTEMLSGKLAPGSTAEVASLVSVGYFPSNYWPTVQYPALKYTNTRNTTAPFFVSNTTRFTVTNVTLAGGESSRPLLFSDVLAWAQNSHIGAIWTSNRVAVGGPGTTIDNNSVTTTIVPVITVRFL